MQVSMCLTFAASSIDEALRPDTRQLNRILYNSKRDKMALTSLKGSSRREPKANEARPSRFGDCLRPDEGL